MDLMPLKDILPIALKKMGIDKKINVYSVITNWEKIVGKKIADNSWPAKVDRGTLVLKVINPVWSHHLLMLKADLIKKINGYLGQNQISDIWFMAGYEKNDGKQEAQDENAGEEWLRPLRLDASEIAAARKMAEEIKDKKMRNKLIYVIIKQMAMEKAKKNKGWKQCAGCETLAPPDKKYCITCGLAKKETKKTIETIKAIKKNSYLKNNSENNIKDSKDNRLGKILWDSPWLSYAEVNKYIPCLPLEYEAAKKKLVHTLIKKLFQPNKYNQFFNGENNIKTCETVLTMLLSEIRPENLTQLHIDNTISEIKKRISESTVNTGRKIHVSTFRN